MPARTSIVMFCLLAASMVGCASPTATLVARRPATINSAGMQRIAVVDVDADQGGAVAQLLSAELRNTRQFQVVSQTELQMAAREPLRDNTGHLNPRVAGEAARNLGLDALLVSRAHRIDGAADGGFHIKTPTAGAALEYELVEARSGLIRDSNVVRFEALSHHAESEMQAALSVCARRLARNLAPHEVNIEIPLAYGEWLGGPIGRGNSWAAQGDWERAANSWREAVDADPRNHAALYNLGVAAEVAENFPEAEDYYLRASRVRSEPMYAEAIQRSARRREQTMAARHQFIVRAGDRMPPPRPTGGQVASAPQSPPPNDPGAGPIQPAAFQPMR